MRGAATSLITLFLSITIIIIVVITITTPLVVAQTADCGVQGGNNSLKIKDQLSAISEYRTQAGRIMWRSLQIEHVAVVMKKCMLIQHRSTSNNAIHMLSSSPRRRFSSSSWIVGLRNEPLRHQHDHTAATATNSIMHKRRFLPTIHTAYDSKRYMSEISRGQDLLADSLSYGSRRKIVLESYAPSGVDVKGFIQVGSTPEEGQLEGEARIVHMNGSIIAFPDTCFLWNVKYPTDITLKSLSVVRLYSPTPEYLFIGCDTPIPPNELSTIKRELRKKDIVVEQMDIMNAMGTFNILNGEDRRVVCALVIDPEE